MATMWLTVRGAGGRMFGAGVVVVALVIAVWQVQPLIMAGGNGAADRSAAGGGTASAAVAAAEPVMPATVRWLPDSVVEGTLFRIVVEGGDPALEGVNGRFGGEPLHFRAESANRFIALAAAPLDSAGEMTLSWRASHVGGATDSRETPITVHAGGYRMERLTVAPQFGQPPSPELQQRMASEAARARAVSAASHETPRMWEPPILTPRESRITSGFGHGRMFNDQIQSRHTGTDFAGAVGAAVRAPARGVVALVDSFHLGGGVIYIDHGAGLVTAYLHLSEQLVRERDVVEPGQLIGRVGATGRVTGPHLHWIVRYGGHSVDGLSLLAQDTIG